MLPAGYLLKRVVPPPGWLKPGLNHIESICTVADCVSDTIVNVGLAWRSNGFGLANSPDVLWSLVQEENADTREAQLFYCTGYEQVLESDGWEFDRAAWRPRGPIQSAAVADAVVVPSAETLTHLGYDVVVFGDFLEHSPLSCNSIAEELRVNRNCLFTSFEEALDAINSGKFGGGCEPGDYTIFAVYLINEMGSGA